MALSLVVLLSSGCSLVFVKSLPENYHPDDYQPPESPDCTTTRAAPVVDTILTTTNVASALYVAGRDDVENKGTAVLAGFLVAALWASSAAHGYVATGKCIEAKKNADSPDFAFRTVFQRHLFRQSTDFGPPRPAAGPRLADDE